MHLPPRNGEDRVPLEFRIVKRLDDDLNVFPKSAGHVVEFDGLEHGMGSVRFRSGHPAEGKADHGEGGGDQEAGILFHGGKVVIRPLKRTARLFVSSREDHGQPVLRSPYDTLLLEGGSLRCAFTAGVLDAFAAVGLRDFKRIYAVSAGAMAATSFLSGQRKHFIDVATSVIEDGQFIRFSSALSEEGIMNLAHLFDHVRRHHPSDFEGAKEAARGREVRFVTTDAESGSPCTSTRWRATGSASCGRPPPCPWSRGGASGWTVAGCSMVASRMPCPCGSPRCRRPEDHRGADAAIRAACPTKLDGLLCYLLVWENPAIAALYESGHHIYNDAVDRIASGGEDGLDILEIAPDTPLKSDGYRVHGDSLWTDYHHGLAKGLDVVAALRT